MHQGKMYFASLDDSPMFRQQLQCLEESAETLRDKSLKFHKGCRKYTDGLGEAYDRDISFANSLETFSGGHNDPISVAFGGPDMAKFAIALREIGSYKEILRSQVEHALNDKLLQFANVDLQDVKEGRKRFDKANATYDQAREKFLSLRKSTRMDIAASIEEELHNARSTFEQARFSLVGALSAVEAKKRFELLEAVGSAMNAHLRYFKQGYELLHQMEPYINQVLAYAQHARQNSNYEQAALNEQMQDYKRQVDQESRRSFNGPHGSPNVDIIQPFSRSSHKMIEAAMHSGAEGKVQTIKQGYLSKRSSNLRGDWKRRFFVLDNRGMLYYYRKQWSRSTCHGSGSQFSMHRSSPSEQGTGLLGRWLSSHYHGGVHDEKSVARHTVNLLTSTIKIDAEQADLRFCFRIISPTKNYTLQAENAADQMDWVEKITGVIASLLSFQHFCSSPASESSSIGSPDNDQRTIEEYTSEKEISSRYIIRSSRSSQQLHYSLKNEKPVDVLQRLPGNDKCADCGAPEPDWASLNLGVLICIECSGIHRNLGVHISKVRSLVLDVKVWEPSVITLFQALGNVFANSIWEGLLQARRTVQADEIPMRHIESEKHKQFFSKPSHDDHISVKEKFIHVKYAEKRFVHKIKDSKHLLSVDEQLWESVRTNDKKAVYRLIVIFEADVNAIHDYGTSRSSDPEGQNGDRVIHEGFDGYSLLHLACQTCDIGMVELLLQHGANVNACDLRNQTPLHHSIMRGRIGIAKLLLTRGANPQAVDKEGKTPFQIIAESDIDDVELIALLKTANR
ncbi:ADP-ribosylation factor GTPase-activating protein AGD3 [Forsythia ovata]|uniref:ADP-ribosylation factor GTPase-activating protein AGD3 n=1 Tax=Forsythia ovata TaxID=205694 RepID=A0ABD1QT74_9LAMI